MIPSSIKEIQSTDDLDKYFDEFVELHQKRWNHQGYYGLFDDEEYRNFLKEIAHAFLKNNSLYFTVALSGNQCIAAECAFKNKKTIYDYLKAFDDRSPLVKHRPGKALMISLIEHAIENEFEVVDLSGGGESTNLRLLQKVIKPIR
jgi:CelD/BcsL family acetyltransferase involved in cellulose biosynthesis